MLTWKHWLWKRLCIRVASEWLFLLWTRFTGCGGGGGGRITIVLTNVQKRKCVEKSKKKKNQSKHGIRKTACTNPTHQKRKERWMWLEHDCHQRLNLAPSRRGPLTETKPNTSCSLAALGTDQLRLYYMNEMDNLVLLACHFNGPLTVAALCLPLIPAEPIHL